jgi:hypothetical protein
MNFVKILLLMAIAMNAFALNSNIGRKASHSFLYQPLTSVQRDALIPTQGLCIYNTTIVNSECYDGTKWVSIQDQISASISGNSAYFLYNTASDIGGYLQANTTSSVAVVADITNASVVNGQTLATFATASGYPGVTFLPTGLIKLHIHAARTAGTKTTALYFEAYKRVLAGTETLLGTSGNSSVLTGVDSEVGTEVTLSTGTTLLATDRIIIKIKALVTGGGSAPNVSLSVENTTSSRFELPLIAGVAYVAPTYNAQSSNFTAAYNKVYLIGATLSVQLPAPVANGQITLKSRGAYTITVLQAASEKIDEVAASFVYSDDKKTITLFSDGTDWFVL